MICLFLDMQYAAAPPLLWSKFFTIIFTPNLHNWDVSKFYFDSISDDSISLSIYQIYVAAFQTYIVSKVLYKYNLHTNKIFTDK